MTNKEARNKMQHAFRRGEFKIEEKHNNFLNLFPDFKRVLEEHKGEELYYVDTGNDYHTSWSIRHKNETGGSSYIDCWSYSDEEVSAKILKLFPITKEEKLEEKLAKKRLRNTFIFGKYKNTKIVDIIKKDSKYIDWCLNNIDGFSDKLEQAKRENG